MPSPNWNTVRFEEQAIIPEVDLLYAQFENEEYIHTEVDDQHLIVMWSSAMSLPSFVSLASIYMGPPADDDKMWSHVSFSFGADVESNPAKVELEALSRANLVTHLTLAYENGILFWRAPAVRMIGGHVLHSEIAYGDEHPRLEKMLGLIGATATPQVVEAIKSDSSPLAQKLELVSG